MSVQARIKAFEAVVTSGTQPQPLTSPRTSLTFSSDDGLDTLASSSAPASPKASLLDDMDFVLASASSSPRSQSFVGAAPSATRSAKPEIPRKPVLPTSPKPLITFNSPPSPPRKTNFDSVANIPPTLPPRRQPSTHSLGSAGASAASSKSPSPALPPRSPATPLVNTNGHMKSSDSLTINHIHSASHNGHSPAAKPRGGRHHQHASSTSSFISLSLSSDPGGDQDIVVDEEIITLPSSAGTSPSDDGLVKPTTAGTNWPSSPNSTLGQKTPTLPQRPFKPPPSTKLMSSSASIASSASSTYSLDSVRSPARSGYSSPKPNPPSQPPYQARRPAPAPPPPKPSNISRQYQQSIPLSSAYYAGTQPPVLRPTPTSSLSGVYRRTPVPPPARARYEALFNRNVKRQRLASPTGSTTNVSSLLSASSAFGHPSASNPSKSSRRAVGWRGTSIDLVTAKALAKEDNDTDTGDGDQVLQGKLVKQIWSCSKLDKTTLSAIWLECDKAKSGSLDRESFVQGMWKIDEELSKVFAEAKAAQRRNLIENGGSQAVKAAARGPSQQPTSPLL